MDCECVEVYFDFLENDGDILYSKYISSCWDGCKTKKYMRCKQCKCLCCQIHYNKTISRSSGTKLKLKQQTFHKTQAEVFICFDCSPKSPFMAYKEQIQQRIDELQEADNDDVSWMFDQLSFVDVDFETNTFKYDGHTYDLSSLTPVVQILASKNGSMVMRQFYNPLFHKVMDWHPKSPYIHYGSVSETNCDISWNIYDQFLHMQMKYPFIICELLTELHIKQQIKLLWNGDITNVKECNKKQLLFLIHDLLEKELKQFNDKEYIFEKYFKQNEINGKILVEMEIKDFAKNIVLMSDDKKMNGPSAKLYDALSKYKLETFHEESDFWCIDYKRYTTPLQIYNEEYKLSAESAHETFDHVIKYDDNGDKIEPITEVQ